MHRIAIIKAVCLAGPELVEGQKKTNEKTKKCEGKKISSYCIFYLSLSYLPARAVGSETSYSETATASRCGGAGWGRRAVNVPNTRFFPSTILKRLRDAT